MSALAPDADAGELGARGSGKSDGAKKAIDGEVLTLLDSLNKSIEDLTATVARGNQTSSADLADDAMRHANAEHLLDYRNVWPDVELSVEILEVGAVNVFDMTFPAALCITLDWEETSLRENLHYHYDLRTQTPTLSSWLLQSEDRFDPEVFVSNAVECEVEQKKYFYLSQCAAS